MRSRVHALLVIVALVGATGAAGALAMVDGGAKLEARTEPFSSAPTTVEVPAVTLPDLEVFHDLGLPDPPAPPGDPEVKALAPPVTSVRPPSATAGSSSAVAALDQSVAVHVDRTDETEPTTAVTTPATVSSAEAERAAPSGASDTAHGSAAGPFALTGAQSVAALVALAAACLVTGFALRSIARRRRNRSRLV
jgi:hypothetical protein